MPAEPRANINNENTAMKGDWNDSLLGDYLWTNTNFGEALPDVMTPMTWSMMQGYFRLNRIGVESATFPMGGNIGGRLYMNLSLVVSLFTGLGFSHQKTLALAADAFGEVPEEVEIPLVPLTRWNAWRVFVPNALRRARLVNGLKKHLPAFINQTRARVSTLKARLKAADSPQALLEMWHDELRPATDEALLMLAAGTSDYKNQSRRLRAKLIKLVGQADANALLSGLQAGRSSLASLGPLLGLARLARGEISREVYLAEYGHRGPSELELSLPTPDEDPDWLDRQLAETGHHPGQARSLIERKQHQHREAWTRFEQRFPRRASRMRQSLERLQEASLTREAARSEVVRMLRVLRPYGLKIGQISGIGPGVFFLSLEEAASFLGGDSAPLELIPARKETYARCAALPPYPGIIRGQFDPFDWAADPDRRPDIFDASGPPPPVSRNTLHGFAGSPGVVHGVVRVLSSPDQGSDLRPGEILVANTTNIGWTPLFPRAAAVITDVGAPLSHAAIVARELGIPAVVGTREATVRLRTGDRVRVRGGEGTVEILDEED